MKSVYSLAAVLFIFIATQKANGQTGWNISVKATPHVSWMQNEDDNNIQHFDRKTTINTNFGLGVGYNFNKRSGLDLDFLYSLQGQKYKMDGLELNQKMNYIKIPLTYNYVFNPKSKVLLVGKLGPQLSILSESKVQDNKGKTIVANSREYFNDVTFGGVAGIGTQFHLSNNWHLTTGLRYDFDFTNAENKKHPDFTPGRANTHNMTAGIEVGLKYSFN